MKRNQGGNHIKVKRRMGVGETRGTKGERKVMKDCGDTEIKTMTLSLKRVQREGSGPQLPGCTAAERTESICKTQQRQTVSVLFG